MRINQFLARAGLGSRRKVEDIVVKGEIAVNDKVITSLSVQIDPKLDKVVYQDRELQLESERESTWLFNKPAGYLCTRSDPQGRPVIFDLLPDLPPPYQAVGRLDGDSRGLLLITRNGDLSYSLMHPRFCIPREYVVECIGKWDGTYRDRLKNGVKMKEGGTGKAVVVSHKPFSGDRHLLKLRLFRGKKREIRYSLGALGLKVIDLQRVSLDFLTLKGVAEGKSRPLTSSEEEKILSRVDKSM